MIDDPRLRLWVEALTATPGLTAITGTATAWRVHVEESLAAASLLADGPVIDVGSGGGTPGLALAAAHPELRFDLLEAQRRRCAFLESATAAFPNVRVVCARAEDWGRGTGRDAYAVALARALAPQPVALEWCLPLVRPGGIAVLYAGNAVEGLDALASELGARGPVVHPVRGRSNQSLLVFEKLGPCPGRFPRRAGIARKRPLLRLDSNE